MQFVEEAKKEISQARDFTIDAINKIINAEWKIKGESKDKAKKAKDLLFQAKKLLEEAKEE